MANVEVYLTKDVEKLGKAGDRVFVKGGFARNYLVPRDMAVVVTKKSLKALTNTMRKIEARKRRELKEAQTVAQRLASFEVHILRQAGEGDKIFGSVTARDIAAWLKEHGLEIDSKRIQLEKPIKSLGIHMVPVRLHSEVAAQLKVWVEKQPTGEEEEQSE